MSGIGPSPGTVHARYVSDRRAEVGRFGTSTVSQQVARHAYARHDSPAFITPTKTTSWGEYDALATRVAEVLVAEGVAKGERVAVLLPDGAALHAALVGIERAGAVALILGPHTGPLEVEHLVRLTGAAVLVSETERSELPIARVVSSLVPQTALLRRHVALDPDDPWQIKVDGRDAATMGLELDGELAARTPSIGDVFLLSPTVATVGKPRCVVQNQSRWSYFHEVVVEAAYLRSDDVFMSLVAAPFGLSAWASHTTPAALGVPTVLLPRFSAELAWELVEREKVSVLCAAPKQLEMMLASSAMDSRDLRSLRVTFASDGHLAVDAVTQLERRAHCIVLRIYGSDETGPLSRTRLFDPAEMRLNTAGEVLDAMDVRLLDDQGQDVTSSGGPGQVACRGPGTSLGYYDDPEANAALITAEGLMLTGDICTIDEEGYLWPAERRSTGLPPKQTSIRASIGHRRPSSAAPTTSSWRSSAPT